VIKFYRKIGQQLLSQNHFSKYMLYAIGEKVLVVIGILIALSVNIWNETKNINTKIKAYKEQLKVELNSDL